MSDISVVHSICSRVGCSESNNTNLLLRLPDVLGTSILLHIKYSLTYNMAACRILGDYR